MSYCTTDDIRTINPKRVYSATSTPTIVQVEGYIDGVAAEIDSILQGRGYTTPVTAGTSSAEFVAFLLALNARGAAALAEQAMFPESRGLMAAPSGPNLWKQYQDGLKYLKEGQLPTGSAGEALPFSFREQHSADSDEPTEDNEWAKHKFGINKDF